MTEPAKDNGGPLHSRREKIAFIVVFAAAVVAAGLTFGWEDAWYGAAGTSCLWTLGSLVVVLFKAEKAGPDSESKIDWPAVRRVEVRVEGSQERYVAHFEDSLTPSTVFMGKKEQKIARVLVRMGLPEATVSTLDDDAPPPPSGVEGGEPYLIEIPAELAP